VGDIQLSLYYKFTAKSGRERVLIIHQHLAKLKTKILWLFFQDMVYIKSLQTTT